MEKWIIFIVRKMYIASLARSKAGRAAAELVARNGRVQLVDNLVLV